MRVRAAVVGECLELPDALVVRAMHDLKTAGSPTADTSGSAESVGPAGLARGSLWYELTDEHSVMEFRPAAPAEIKLSLHVVIDTDADMTIAWWEAEHGADNGMWVAQVGLT